MDCRGSIRFRPSRHSDTRKLQRIYARAVTLGLREPGKNFMGKGVIDFKLRTCIEKIERVDRMCFSKSIVSNGLGKTFSVSFTDKLCDSKILSEQTMAIYFPAE